MFSYSWSATGNLLVVEQVFSFFVLWDPLVKKDGTIPFSAVKNMNSPMFGVHIKEGGKDLSSNAVLPWKPPHQQVQALTWRLQGLGQSPQRWLVGETAVHFFMQTYFQVLTKEAFEVASSIKHRWKKQPVAGAGLCLDTSVQLLYQLTITTEEK